MGKKCSKLIGHFVGRKKDDFRIKKKFGSAVAHCCDEHVIAVCGFG